MKSTRSAYLLCIFLGLFSAHNFYLGKHRKALLYLFTGQLLLIGWIIDLISLPEMVEEINDSGLGFYSIEMTREEKKKISRIKIR